MERMKGRRAARVALAGWLLAGCAADVEDHIATLERGGEGEEEAKMALSLARQDAIEPLLEAFADKQKSSRARSSMADALARLYIREKDRRILDALTAALDDGQTEVRRASVRILGDLEGTTGIAPLVNRLGPEPEDEVRQEILVALGLMSLRESRTGMGNSFERTWSTALMDTVQRARFVDALKALRTRAMADSLRSSVLEWLEVVAEESVQSALERELAADVAGAEQRLQEGLALVPDSKNVNQRLGKFLYESGQQAEGLKVLFANGAAVRVPRLPRAPAIDGTLAAGEWSAAARIDRFYQNISRMRAFLVAGRAEAYLGYRGDLLYLAVKGWEPQTDNLEAKATARDQNTWLDDCVELFFDPDRDGRTYYQIVVNNRNVVFDQYGDGSTPGGNQGWNGQMESATHIDADAWSLEIAVPMRQFKEGTVGPGAVWGANVARIRIANASEYGQWAPTYGSALRPDRFGYLVFD